MLPNFKRSEPDSTKTPASGTGTNAPQAASMAAPRPTAPPLRTGAERFAPSVIGPDLIITGNLISKGEMQIDGEVQGDIRGTNIIVGERARITGTIVAEEAVIRGQVLGSVRSRRVMLQSSSRVEGDIYHQTLAIEQGAYFEGKSRRTDDPIAGVGLPASPARAEQHSSASPQAAPALVVPTSG